jgi:hypothetical protein
MGEEYQVSRRGFLGWGAILATATVVPGATMLMGESAAAAATLTPYALSSWRALTGRSVQASAPGRSPLTLKVVQVTDLATVTTRKMTGDVFSVKFQTAAKTAIPGQIYTIAAPSVGSFPLFLGGSGGIAQAVVNRRLPA